MLLKVTDMRQKLIKLIRKIQNIAFGSTTHLTPTCPASQHGGRPTAMETAAPSEQATE